MVVESKCHDDDECSMLAAEQRIGYFGNDDIDDLPQELLEKTMAPRKADCQI